MRYIETLKEGDRIGDVYLCKNKQSLLTKNGKPYESVILQDRTGTLDGKIWDPGSMGIGEFEEMDYVEVVGDVTSFQGHLQLNIRRARKCGEGEFDPGDYLPVSGNDIEGMYSDLMTILGSVKNTYLQQLIQSFFGEESFKKAFCNHSAAKNVHHGFVGGLLEHTLGVVRLCNYLATAYPVLNRDLLLAAAAFHDIGKLKELSAFPQNDYTDEGQLLGHIVIGVQWVHEHISQIEGFPVGLSAELAHCILAHHGELEFGSPKKPALVEAVALSMADNTDAKLETMREILEAPGTGDGWLGYNRLFESNIRKTGK